MTTLKETIAHCYADAWRDDIKQHLGQNVPSWEEMGPLQKEAMMRVAGAVIDKLAKAGFVIETVQESPLSPCRPGGSAHF